MKALALFCLLLILFQPVQAFQQPAKPRTVALVFAEGTVFLPLVDAEKEYRRLQRVKRRSPEQEKWFAALTWTLGTLPEHQTAPHVNATRDRLDWEIRRGVRKPLQEPRRD